MVGYFVPIAASLKEWGTQVEAVYRSKGPGDGQRFTERLGPWGEVVIVTSTSINSTLDDLLESMGKDVLIALMGPSTLLGRPISRESKPTR